MKQFYLPELPPTLNYEDFIADLAAAHQALSKLDALLSTTPNPRIFERTFTTQEAVLSSRIEGTDATLSDVFDHEAGVESSDGKIREDVTEIVNYRKALNEGLALLDKRPLGENELKTLHQILLSGGRGANRAPGDFRKVAVYIGRPGAGVEKASYVPPAASDVALLISNLLNYVHNYGEKDDLVRIAVAHYQFEAVHPFLDGNGRVGRLLITLLLCEKNLLAYPYLYLSEYFENNRSEYYDRLRNVSQNSDWSAWIRFFLNGIEQQSNENIKMVEQVAELYKSLQQGFVEISSEFGLSLLNALFNNPIFNATILKDHVGVSSQQTAYNLIDKLLAAGYITDTNPEKQRDKRYEFTLLLDTIRSKR